MNRNIKAIEKKISMVQQEIEKSKKEIQDYQEIAQRQNVKINMLNLLDTIKHYNASYYYNRDTKDLSEIEALRVLNRKIKFPEVEQKINAIFSGIKEIKSNIVELENDKRVKGILAKFLKKKIHDKIENEREKLSKQKQEFRNICDLYVRVQSGREILKEFFKKNNKLIKLNLRLEHLKEKRELDFREYKKHEVAYAKAASLDSKTREQAEKVKKEILSQVKIYPFCPYCQNNLGDYPHADHIYPVSRGGLSTIENMVYICSNCNLKKSDATLREFIHKYKINRNKVEEILEKLSKKF